MTFWKRRNVVPCFIIFYRRFLLSNEKSLITEIKFRAVICNISVYIFLADLDCVPWNTLEMLMILMKH